MNLFYFNIFVFLLLINCLIISFDKVILSNHERVEHNYRNIERIYYITINTHFFCILDYEPATKPPPKH